MIAELRREFNSKFTPELYQRFLNRLDERCGTHVGFRNCETPCFFPAELLDRTARAGAELVHQLIDNAAYLSAADEQIPVPYRVPNTDPRPLFVQADFGLVQTQNGFEPKLVEIQGFPSLYAYQIELARTYNEVYGLDYSCLLSSPSEAEYLKLLTHTLLNGHAPENVVLLEIDPLEQKTLADFILTERFCHIPTVNIRAVLKQGNRLYYQRDGLEIPIKRIYNRAIVDELIRKKVDLAFDFRDDLDIEWAGHPNWFFRISKFSLPYLHHATVPHSQFLSDVQKLPAPPDELVLKPLFSFAGLGVIVGPTLEQIEAIPEVQKTSYLLQERVTFQPVIDTPFGATNAEIRVMYIWADKLTPVTTIIRMGRGKMMGVDHNRDQEWVGGSAGFVI